VGGWDRGRVHAAEMQVLSQLIDPTDMAEERQQ